MNKKLLISSLFIVLFLTIKGISQENKSIVQKSTCVHCNMFVNDEKHQSKATTLQNKALYFDAIECLVNYVKRTSLTSYKSLAVANYIDGTFIDATKATYLISKAIKSPMGENLSAFENRMQAKKYSKRKDDAIYNWKALMELFKKTKVGTINHTHHNRPDAHAPIGVMGDHLHEKGKFMVSFRSMSMKMNGLANFPEVYGGIPYMVVPQEMLMKMYMLGIMYAPTEKLTLMAMQHIIKNDMDLNMYMMMMGNSMSMVTPFSTYSNGLGDFSIGGMYSISNTLNSSSHINLGISIPIGSVKERTNTPMMQNAKMPYSMQLGSGTFDVNLGATYKTSTDYFSFGIQPMFLFRFGKNSEGYKFGNKQQINLWSAYKLKNWLSISTRLLAYNIEKISGSDLELNPMMAPTTNANFSGGSSIIGFFGFNFLIPNISILEKFKFGLEMGIPIFENYNGIQMDEEKSFQFGIKYSL